MLDTNVVSETLRPSPAGNVVEWLIRYDAELALPTVTIAEIAFGICKIRPDERADRLNDQLDYWRRRFAGRVFGFTEEAAILYGEIMGSAVKRGRAMSAPDGMIAAIACANGSRLATRNIADFEHVGVDVIDPWKF